MLRLNFHSDPGHGWVEIPRADAQRLGLLPCISRYSYQSRDGRTLYLEEDCDYSALVRAARGAGEPIEINELHTDADSFIRALPHYQAPAPAVAFHERECGGAYDGIGTVYSDADPGL
jgi:hypothetical protein